MLKIEVSDKLTGDGFNTGLYGLILAASAIFALATVAFRRKASNN